MTNWNQLLSSTRRRELFRNFVEGNLSRRQLERSFSFSNDAGELRSVLYNRGKDDTRQLARKALRRRGLL